MNGEAPLIRYEGHICRCDDIHYYCISDNNGMADTVEVVNIINGLSRYTSPELAGINVLLDDLQLVVSFQSLSPLFWYMVIQNQ